MPPAPFMAGEWKGTKPSLSQCEARGSCRGRLQLSDKYELFLWARTRFISLLDIAIELLESDDEVEKCIKPTALRIAGRGFADESEKSLALSQISLDRWEVWGSVPL